MGFNSVFKGLIQQKIIIVTIIIIIIIIINLQLFMWFAKIMGHWPYAS